MFGRFNKTTKHLSDQARKAMFSVLKKSSTLCLDIDLQLHVFDTLVTPVLLYGGEVWGVNDVNIIQQFQSKYLKQLFSIKNQHLMGVRGAWRSSYRKHNKM